MSKTYRLYCDYCHYNKITDNWDLPEFKRSSIQKGIPQWNEEKKKVDQPAMIQLPKRFKCPNCGRLIRPKLLNNK